jgi:hypothetical protein
MSLTAVLWQCLAPEAGTRAEVTVQVVRPAAAAAAAGPGAAPAAAGPGPQQQANAAGASDGGGVHWSLLQQEGMAFVKHQSNNVLVGTHAWRRILGPYGDWFLFKAQAVRGGGRARYVLLLPVTVRVRGDAQPEHGPGDSYADPGRLHFV